MAKKKQEDPPKGAPAWMNTFSDLMNLSIQHGPCLMLSDILCLYNKGSIFCPVSNRSHHIAGSYIQTKYVIHMLLSSALPLSVSVFLPMSRYYLLPPGSVCGIPPHSAGWQKSGPHVHRNTLLMPSDELSGFLL